jgi:hypothetical protein
MTIPIPSIAVGKLFVAVDDGDGDGGGGTTIFRLVVTFFATICVLLIIIFVLMYLAIKSFQSNCR